MAVELWQPGKLYQPGDLVRPTMAGAVSQPTLLNPSFEEGDTGWTWTERGGQGIEGIAEGDPAFDGTWRLFAGMQSGGKRVLNDARIPTKPGEPISVQCFVRYHVGAGDDPRFSYVTLRLEWWSATMQPLTTTFAFFGNPQDGGQGIGGDKAHFAWKPISIGAVAPPGAAFWSFGVDFNWPDDEAGTWYVDAVTVQSATQEAPNPFIFRAVQAAAGFSGNSEPDWPTMLGVTVIDNEVTWEAVAADHVVWEARRILVSGDSEPDWPTEVDGSVPDGSIVWVLDPRRVTDARLPQSKLAAIAASKVFTADGDIAPFSATNNPLDLSTPEDAGFIPFGLQTYGSNPITAIGLYRGNLVLSNSMGTQIWQVDPDPEGMALLDAVPIGCTFPKTMQPIGNDLVFLTEVGVRNMGTVGASVNLQAGYFGKPIDDLVIAAIKAARNDDREPISVYWPGAGQYWLIFGEEVFVHTVVDGGKSGMSWSRYVFPQPIDYATVLGEELYLRAGDLVWLVSAEAQTDDTDMGGGAGGTDAPFSMVLQWPHLDFGSLGVEKELLGFDLVGKGQVKVSIGYDQRDPEYDPVSGPWTAPFEIEHADTLPGQPIPLPVGGPSFALRLEFDGEELEREFIAANLYVAD